MYVKTTHWLVFRSNKDIKKVVSLYAYNNKTKGNMLDIYIYLSIVLLFGHVYIYLGQADIYNTSMVGSAYALPIFYITI